MGLRVDLAAGSNFNIRKKAGFSCLILSLVLILSSCARAPVRPPAYPVTGEVIPQLPPTVLRQDIIHIVAPGETIWRISKMYDADMADIMAANRLNKPEELCMGQRLVVPQAAPLRPVIPLYRSHKWRYLIVHHSATDEGNAFSLFNLHLRRGFAGLGYHFVIDNGTSGKADGQIEASPRWVKQDDGAHCQASGMNHKGIGICLVGNFSRERMSEKQLDSLAYLVKTMMKYYNIPLRNVMGHGQVPGAKTECPGKYFPWARFKERIRS